MFTGVRPKHGPTHGETFHLEAGWYRLDAALSSHWNQVTIPTSALAVVHSELCLCHTSCFCVTQAVSPTLLLCETLPVCSLESLTMNSAVLKVKV